MDGIILKWVFTKLSMRERICIEQARIKVQWQFLVKSIMKVRDLTNVEIFSLISERPSKDSAMLS
jgi:hypothetical protein